MTQQKRFEFDSRHLLQVIYMLEISGLRYLIGLMRGTLVAN